MHVHRYRGGGQNFDALVNELLAAGSETQVAYRDGKRYVARLVRYRDVGPAASGPFRLQLAEYGSPDKLRMAPLTRRNPRPGEVEMEVKPPR